jgi:hypothetical protein
MKNILKGGIVGGIILFIWSALAWTVLPLHKSSLHNISNEDAVISSLQTNLDAQALYVFPGRPDPSAGQPAMDAWTEKAMRGPVGLIVYSPQGTDPMMVGQFIVGIIIDIMAALLAAWFLSRSTARTAPFLTKVVFCGVLGIFISFASYIPLWNWMTYPLDYTTGMVADAVLGWLLAGIGIAALAKTPSPEQA